MKELEKIVNEGIRTSSDKKLAIYAKTHNLITEDADTPEKVLIYINLFPGLRNYINNSMRKSKYP